MSGIAAVTSDTACRTDIMELLEPMRYRGIDGVDYVRLGAVGLGHLHHDTHPNEKGSQQPVKVDGTWVTIDGRIDNRRQVLANLSPSLSEPITDAELVCHAYNQFGIDCLSSLVGAYAITIWDSTRQRLYCARDKTGIRGLYFALTPANDLLVASELGAIHATRDDWRINEGLVGEYLLGDIVTSGETFYDGIWSLQPGSYLVHDEGTIETVHYWPTRNDITDSVEDPPAEFATLLRRVVQDRAQVTDPHPVMMSGGLDSTAITAFVADDAKKSVPAHSVVFPDRPEISEEPKIDVMTAETDVTVSKIRELPDVRSPRRWQWLLPDSPCLDSTSFVYEAVFEQLPNDRRVLLTGLGGNLFDGSPIALSDMLTNWEFRRLLRTVRNSSLSLPAAAAYMFLPLISRKDVERILGGRWYPPWPDWLNTTFAERVDLADRFRSTSLDGRFRRRSVRKTVRDLRDPYMDFATDSVRRLGLHHGIELRHPWLDARLFEFLFGLQTEYLYYDGEYKQLFRSAAASVLPRSVRTQSVSANTYSAFIRDALAAEGHDNERSLNTVDALSVDDFDGILSRGGRKDGMTVWRWLTTAAFLDA